MEIDFNQIAESIYTSNKVINGTQFFYIDEYIEALESKAEFRGRVFYENVRAALFGFGIKEKSNIETQVAWDYLEMKIHGFEPTETAQPSVDLASESTITTQELMKRLQVTEPTIIKWREKGYIPFIKIGRSVRFDYQAVVKALEKRRF
jgi:excisionase family DNA binding protein